MQTHKLSIDVPLDDRWDVLVAGGGPAGCSAAAAAAREGARTLLIESTGALGGMGSNGLVPAWCPFSDKHRMIYRGLAERVFTAARAAVPHIPSAQLDWVPIDAEQLKRVYDELMHEFGVEVSLFTTLAGVHAENHAVSDVLTVNKRGLSAIRAKIFVDATGDADLAAWAGADVLDGEDGGREFQPATHCFILTNVDDYSYYHRFDQQAVLRRIFDSGRYPLICDRHFCVQQIASRVYGFNVGHLHNVDGTHPESLSCSMSAGRKLAKQYLDALREFAPAAFASAHLVATAPLQGIRETRRIAGDYVLTKDDFLARRSFPDEICRNSYFIDVHHSAEESKADREGRFDLAAKHIHLPPGESHGVPYRCLTPRSLDNVLVAGRCISTDRPVQGSIRVMPVCLATGEAAGLAAAMAAAGDKNVHKVDPARLRSRLRDLGAYLP